MRAVAFVIAVALVAVPTAVWAGHHFSDVPDTHPFHKEISAVADAGITTGFPDGTFRPGNNITRQAAAAFFERGLGRVASAERAHTPGAPPHTGSNPVVLGGNSDNHPRAAEIASVGLDAGAAGDGNGLVYVQASIAGRPTNPTWCPCEVEFWIARDGEPIGQSSWLTLAGGDMGVSEWGLRPRFSGVIGAVAPLAADTSAAYQLYARLWDDDTPQVFLWGTVHALYVPLGPDGDSTVAYEHECSPQEVESNDGVPTATPMPAENCIRGRVAGSADMDLFSIDLTAGQTLVAETKSPEGAGCAGASRIQLLAVGGAVASDTDSGVGVCSRLSYSVVSTGTYHLKVTSATNTAFDYRLEVTR